MHSVIASHAPRGLHRKIVAGALAARGGSRHSDRRDEDLAPCGVARSSRPRLSSRVARRAREYPLACVGSSAQARRAGEPTPAAHLVADEQRLRELVGSPLPLVAAKVAERLNELTRQFIERSPFVCIATADLQGGLDVSPRGDPAGFVRILDPRTLLIPERPGNRIADTLTNLLHDPRVGLLFLLPGITDSFASTVAP